MEHRGALDFSGVGPDVIVDGGNPVMVWQPIVNLYTLEVLGYEALARFGGASPAVVFDYAADRGIAPDLDALCIAQALRRPPRSGLIFVNVTAATVRSGHFPRIPHALASRVVWELPETIGWHPRDLPGSGTLALDDVGAGHAELVRLAMIPWRYVKADRGVVDRIATHPEQQALVLDLLNRAREGGGFVIAEGVESPDDAAWLTRAGVAYGQGFLWGHPQVLEV